MKQWDSPHCKVTGWGHIFDMIAREKANRELRLKKSNLRSKRKNYVSMLDQHQKNFSELTENEKQEARKKVEEFLKRDRFKTIILRIILLLLIIFALYFIWDVFFKS